MASNNIISINFGRILETLLLIFIVLKCCNLIDWSWGMILIPAYVGIFFWIISKMLIAAIKKKASDVMTRK